MDKTMQLLLDNKDTLLEGIVYATKELVYQKKEDFFDNKEQAIDSINFQYENVEIYYEETWRGLKEVKREFSSDNLKRYRRDLDRLVTSAIKLMAVVDKAVESKAYWEFFREGEDE